MIFQRYLAREIIVTFLAVTLVLSLIYASATFLRFLGDVAGGGIPASATLSILGLKLLGSMGHLLPLALYLAVLLGFGRLYRDQEMTALSACGIGPNRLLRIVFVLASVIAVGIGAITLYAAPWAERQVLHIRANAEAQASFASLAAGRFTSFRGANAVFYVERASEDKREMEGVFAHRRVNGVGFVLTADKAYQTVDIETGERFVVFVDGYRYEGTPGQADFKVTRYREHGLRIPAPEALTPEFRKATRPTQQIWNSDRPDDRAELQWRLGVPASAVIMALLSVLLSKAKPRQGRYANLFTAIVIYMVYSNLLGVGEKWYEQGQTPAILGIWWVHGLALALLLGIYTRQVGLAWLFRSDRTQTA